MEEAEDRTATMRVWITLIFVVVLMPSVAAGPATMPAEPAPSRIIKCDAQGLTLVGLSEDGGSVYYAETVDEAVREASLVVLAAPVDKIIELARQIAPHLPAGALVTLPAPFPASSTVRV